MQSKHQLSQRSEIPGKKEPFTVTVLTVAFQVSLETTKIISLASNCWDPACKLQSSEERLGGRLSSALHRCLCRVAQLQGLALLLLQVRHELGGRAGWQPAAPIPQPRSSATSCSRKKLQSVTEMLRGGVGELPKREMS